LNVRYHFFENPYQRLLIFAGGGMQVPTLF
jgi:hypothetical protein